MITQISKLFRVITGQDIIEYALMAGFVAVAAAAIMPGVSNDIHAIFHKITCAYKGGVADVTNPINYTCVVPSGSGR